MSRRLTSLILLSVAAASGEPLTFTAAVRTMSAERVTWSVEMRTRGSVRPAAVQWSFHYDPATVRNVQVTASDAAAAAGKSVRCSTRSGLMTCLLWGPNQNQIAEGSIAVVKCNLSGHAAAGFLYHLQDVSAASAKGEGLPVEGDAAESSSPSRTPVWEPALLFRRQLYRFLRIYRTQVIVAAVIVIFSTSLLLLLARALWRKSRSERKLRAI